jgi:hypothetical protein
MWKLTLISRTGPLERRGAAEFPLRRLIPHNAVMCLREIFRLVVGSLILCLAVLSPLAAKARSARGLDSGYVSALAAADHFLQAWQTGDLENGTALLSSHAKDAATTDVVEKFFANSVSSAYEIGRGKLLKRGRFEFPVVMVTEPAKNTRARRHFSSIIVVNTGNNEWAVDKLP